MAGICCVLLLFHAFRSAVYYRPLPQLSQHNASNFSTLPSTKLREIDETRVPLGLALARFIVLCVVTAVMKWVMQVRNTFVIVRDTNMRYLHRVMRKRPPGVALITVGNHASSFDDPGLMGEIKCLVCSFWLLPLGSGRKIRPEHLLCSHCSRPDAGTLMCCGGAETAESLHQVASPRGTFASTPGKCAGRWPHRTSASHPTPTSRPSWVLAR